MHDVRQRSGAGGSTGAGRGMWTIGGVAGGVELRSEGA